MRQRTARQKHGHGGWHYVDMGRVGGYPIGYCAGHEPHDTETQARECYAAWLRDSIDLGHSTSWTSCEVPDCDQPTQGGAAYARDGYHFVSLCPEHLTGQMVIDLCQLDKPAGDSWHS